MHEHARERVAVALSSGITLYPLGAYYVGNHLHGTCSFACCSLSYPPQPAQKDVVTYSQYNHQTQLTVPGSIYTLRISGYPVPMGDKILAQAQNNDFLALARKIAQETGNMPLIQGTQWAPLQDALKAIGCDHRAFPLPSHWTPSAILTGHEPGIHEAVFKQIGEFSLPLKAGLKMTLFPLEEIKCSYPGPTVGGVPGPPCNKSVACGSFRIIVDNTPCSTPRNDLGIHVNFGPFQEVMCNHFICNECLPHWHKEVIGELTQSLESPSGSKIQVRCFIPSCDCTVGDPLVLEETMRALGCNFIVNTEYSKSPIKRSSTKVKEEKTEEVKFTDPTSDSVQIVAHASLDPELIISWASDAADFNFGVHASMVSVCGSMQLRDPDTDEWAENIPGDEKIFCTTDVTFSYTEPLAPTFSAIFTLKAILDPVSGCLKFCGITPCEFSGVDPSEIIRVNPLTQTEAPKQPHGGAKRTLDLDSMGEGGASTLQIKRVFITNVKGTFFGMSESVEASKRR